MKLVVGAVATMVAATSLIGCASKQKAWKETKTISMPECSVGISFQTEGTAYSNQFANKGLSTNMVVYTPIDEHRQTFQEIADESCGRIKAKLEAMGYEVLTGPELAAKSEKYAELQKEHFTKEPDIRDTYAVIPSSKTGVPKGGIGFSVGMGYSSMTRNLDSILVTPALYVTFGTVKGSGSSVTDSNGTTTSSTMASYSPLVNVTRDRSGMSWMGKDMNGNFGLSQDHKADNVAWLTSVEKGETKTNAISAVSSVLLGGRLEKTAYYQMKVDPKQMKAAILAQLEKGENEYIAQIKEIRAD